eukprot:6185240-Pleurochrysis_carterae.AAC.2
MAFKLENRNLRLPYACARHPPLPQFQACSRIGPSSLPTVSCVMHIFSLSISLPRCLVPRPPLLFRPLLSFILSLRLCPCLSSPPFSNVLSLLVHLRFFHCPSPSTPPFSPRISLNSNSFLPFSTLKHT